MLIPFSPPKIDDRVIAEVVEALRSGWITTGPRTKAFEKKIAAYTQAPSVLCLNSATAGLEIMLRWFGIGPGDEVILPAYTYSATANVIIHCGAKPVFVDVGEDFNINIEEVKQAVSPRTKVIMPVDFGGLPCNYLELNSLVESLTFSSFGSAEQEMLGRVMVLADAAHSLGGIYQGKQVGSLADCSVFSFHAVKNLTTAEGGAVCLNLPLPFNNDDLYKRLSVMTLHGQNKDALSKLKPGSWRYDIVEPGYKFNMPDVLAAIGLSEIDRYKEETLPKRKAICMQYVGYLSAFKWAILPIQNEPLRESSYHLFPLRIAGAGENERDAIIQILAEKGVSVNVHFIPIPMMSYYRSLEYKIEDYPRTFKMYENEISLPVYYTLEMEQIAYILSELGAAVEQVMSNISTVR